MRDKRIWLFVTLAMMVAGVTFFNVYTSNRVEKVHVDHTILKKNMRLQTENEELKKELGRVLPSVQEQERRTYLQLTKDFMRIAFTRTSNGFEERKMQAKKLMSEELYKQFFPTEDYSYGDGYSSEPSDMKFYLQEYELGTNQIDVIVECISNVKVSPDKDKERTKNVLKVTAQKENDTWKIVSVEQLYLQLI